MASPPQRPVPRASARLPWRLALLAAVALALAGCGASARALPRNATHASSAGSAPAGVYAHDGAGMLTAATAHVPYLLYAPESAGNGVDVIDPGKMRVIAHYPTGLDPQHVVPAWDLKTLYSTNDLANTLTPFDPRTGAPSGPAIPVDDPYNMYVTPDGRTRSSSRRPVSTWTSETRTPSPCKSGCP